MQPRPSLGLWPRLRPWQHAKMRKKTVLLYVHAIYSYLNLFPSIPAVPLAFYSVVNTIVLQGFFPTPLGFFPPRFFSSPLFEKLSLQSSLIRVFSLPLSTSLSSPFLLKE